MAIITHPDMGSWVQDKKVELEIFIYKKLPVLQKKKKNGKSGNQNKVKKKKTGGQDTRKLITGI